MYKHLRHTHIVGFIDSHVDEQTGQVSWGRSRDCRVGVREQGGCVMGVLRA